MLLQVRTEGYEVSVRWSVVNYLNQRRTALPNFRLETCLGSAGSKELPVVAADLLNFSVVDVDSGQEWGTVKEVGSFQIGLQHRRLFTGQLLMACI